MIVGMGGGVGALILVGTPLVAAMGLLVKAPEADGRACQPDPASPAPRRIAGGLVDQRHHAGRGEPGRSQEVRSRAAFSRPPLGCWREGCGAPMLCPASGTNARN